MNLEELLREAARRGMTHLTLYPVHSDDGKTIYWHARATPSTAHSYVQTTSLDPAEAVGEVLKALPKASKRAVTAAVNERRGYPEPSDLSGLPPGMDPLDLHGGATGLHPEPESEIDKWLPRT